MTSPLHLAFITGAIFIVAIVALVPRRYWRPLGLTALALFVILIPFQQAKYSNDTWTDYAVYAMAAISLNMLIGMTGQISLGQGAFVAIAAYTVSIMVAQHLVPFYAAAIAGALAAAAVGFLLGLPAARLTGPYLAIATLGLALAVPEVAKWPKIERWTGANQGINVGRAALRPYMPHVPGWFPTLPGGHVLQPDEFEFFLTALVLAGCALLVWNVRRSRTGRILIALRDSEPAAQVMGINLARYRVTAFMISALIAGLSGAFLAYSVGSVHPDTFGLDLSIAVLAMIIVGGLNSILGSVLGAIAIRWLTLNTTKLPAPTDLPVLGSHLPVVFKTFPTYAAGVYYGLALVLIMILMPYGIAGAYFRLIALPYRQLRRGLGLRDATAPPGDAGALTLSAAEGATAGNATASDSQRRSEEVTPG